MDKKRIVLCGLDKTQIRFQTEYLEEVYEKIGEVTDVKGYDGLNGILGPAMAEFLDAQIDLDIAGIVLLQNLRKHMCGPDNADVTIYNEYPDTLYAQYLSNFNHIKWKDITDDIKNATQGNIYEPADIIIYLDQIPELMDDSDYEDIAIRREAYLYCAAKFGWEIVPCYFGNKLRVNDRIKSDIIEIMSKKNLFQIDQDF